MLLAEERARKRRQRGRFAAELTPEEAPATSACYSAEFALKRYGEDAQPSAALPCFARDERCDAAQYCALLLREAPASRAFMSVFLSYCPVPCSMRAFRSSDALLFLQPPDNALASVTALRYHHRHATSPVHFIVACR